MDFLVEPLETVIIEQRCEVPSWQRNIGGMEANRRQIITDFYELARSSYQHRYITSYFSFTSRTQCRVLETSRTMTRMRCSGNQPRLGRDSHKRTAEIATSVRPR